MTQNSAFSIIEFLSKGFIPHSRGSFTLDFIVVAIFFILLVQTWSIIQARRQRLYVHRNAQLALAAVLVVALTVFEFEMRTIGWVSRAENSPYFLTWVYPSLYFHLVFAISAFFLWILVICQALRYFRGPLASSRYRSSHRKIAIPAAITLYGTAVSGWVFYWLAFVA